MTTNPNDYFELRLTRREANALLIAAEVGMASGKMLEALKEIEDDLALALVIAKLRKDLR